MGWWKINCNGGIDTKHRSVGTLTNALPGQDHPENHYNGDPPADVLDALIWTLARKLKGNPQAYQYVKFFTEWKTIPPGFRVDRLELWEKPAWIGEDLVDELVHQAVEAWDKIEELYQQAWNRPSYPEERMAVARFCVGSTLWPSHTKSKKIEEVIERVNNE